MIKNIYSLYFLCFFLISCKDEAKKEVQLSPIPHIEFKSITQSRIHTNPFLGPADSITITITYQDGDSDLGINYEEIDTPPYQSMNSDGSVNKYHYNYWVEVYKQINGKFKLAEFSPPLDSRYPRIGNKGGVTIGGNGNPFTIHTKTATEGEIISSYLFPTQFTPLPDTLKFRITIVDRALNESNTIETSSLILSK